MTTALLSPAESNQTLKQTLERSGWRCATWPALQIQAPSNPAQLRDAIDNLFGYDWLILKNPRAAEYFLHSFLETHAADELDELRVLTIGTDTARQVAQFQVHVDIALDRFAHQNVCREIDSYVGEDNLARLNILVPSANIVRETFAEQFADAGARVDSVAAYRTTAAADQLVR